MKKIMMMAAAALIGGAATAAIESGVVGYTTTSLLPNDYTMFGIQFTGTDGTDGVKFKDLKGNFYGGDAQSSSDNILVWENGVYTFYYYGDWGVEGEAQGWNNLWYDAESYDASEVAIKPGTACWYLRRSEAEADITVAGGIKLEPVAIPVLANDYTMFSNPYPTPIKFKNLVVENAFGGDAQSSSDNILVWENGVYTFYYYGDWGVEGEAQGWNNLWYDAESYDASEVEIGTGIACWYLRRSAEPTTISFTSPLAK